jgi:hypothetical protein
MFGYLYTPLFILQAFCVYHAYRYHAEQRWYWFILFFPGIGCAFYLYHHFYNRRSLQSITEGLKVVVNSNYKIEQLEKAVKFNDNVANKLNLADAYIQVGRYKEAIALYQSCLQGFMADDPALLMKLLQASYLDKDYERAITYGQSLEHDKRFKDAEERISYAWAFYFQGDVTTADRVFKEMDKTFTNYRHRLEYCKFLLLTGEDQSFAEKSDEMLEEFEHMRGERRLYRRIISELKELKASKANAKTGN